MSLSENAGIFEMAHPLVVGGQRHPGTLRLIDAQRELLFQQLQIARPRHNAFASVQAVGYLHAVRGIFGQHHHAAHLGIRRGKRIPVRFPVSQSG